jgi:hypothetical protein
MSAENLLSIQPRQQPIAVTELRAMATERMQELNEAYDSLLQERLNGAASEA